MRSLSLEKLTAIKGGVRNQETDCLLLLSSWSYSVAEGINAANSGDNAQAAFWGAAAQATDKQASALGCGWANYF